MVSEMEKARSLKHSVAIVVAILLVVMVFVGFYLQSQPRRLYPEEVREYKGENLSSINDVQENAIRGNQLVNESTYRLTVACRRKQIWLQVDKMDNPDRTV